MISCTHHQRTRSRCVRIFMVFNFRYTSLFRMNYLGTRIMRRRCTHRKRGSLTTFGIKDFFVRDHMGILRRQDTSEIEEHETATNYSSKNEERIEGRMAKLHTHAFRSHRRGLDKHLSEGATWEADRHAGGRARQETAWTTNVRAA